MFGARHAGEDGHHLRMGAAEAERPLCERRLRVEGGEFLRERVVVAREAAAEQRLHDDDGDVELRERLVEVLGVEVARVHLLRVAPVDVVHLDLHEVPLVRAVALDAPLERLGVAVVGEAEAADAALCAQLGAPVQGAVFEVAPGERLEAAVANGVEEVVVDVVRLEELERVLEHLLAGRERILLGREVRELRRDDVVLAGVAARLQGLAERGLRLAAAVGGRGVEVGHAAVEEHLDLAVEKFLVDVRRRVAVLDPAVRVPAVHRRQAHRAVAEQRDLLPVETVACCHCISLLLAVKLHCSICFGRSQFPDEDAFGNPVASA